MVYIKISGEPVLQLLFLKEARNLTELKYNAYDEVYLKAKGKHSPFTAS